MLCILKYDILVLSALKSSKYCFKRFIYSTDFEKWAFQDGGKLEGGTSRGLRGMTTLLPGENVTSLIPVWTKI